MNAKRRIFLKEAVILLNKASGIIEDARDDEQDCLNNLPENLQNSRQYETMEDAIDSLEDALESIDEAKDNLSDVGA